MPIVSAMAIASAWSEKVLTFPPVRSFRVNTYVFSLPQLISG